MFLQTRPTSFHQKTFPKEAHDYLSQKPWAFKNSAIAIAFRRTSCHSSTRLTKPLRALIKQINPAKRTTTPSGYDNYLFDFLQ